MRSRRPSLNLSKIRGKGLMERIGKSRRYSTTAEGVATLTAYSILRDQVIKPLLAGFIRRQGRPPKLIHPLDLQPLLSVALPKHGQAG